ncbi:MAG: hypothetical protein ABFD08_05390 [Syntrophomonas sp.]
MLKNKSKIKVAASLLAVMVAVVLIAGAVPVMAQGNNAAAVNCSGLGIGRMGGSLIDTVAGILGVSSQDIAAERRTGKSLADIAAEKSMDKEQLLNAVLEQKQENLNQALKDGKITQDQYDQCSQQMSDKIEKNLTRTETGPNGQGAGKGKAMQGFRRGGNGTCSGTCQQLGQASNQN